MLLFRERPDEVFYDIVRESLTRLAEELKPAELIAISDTAAMKMGPRIAAVWPYP